MADTSGASGAKEGLNKSLAWDVGIHTDLHLGGVVISNAWYSTVSLQPLGESHRAAVAQVRETITRNHQCREVVNLRTRCS